MTALQKMQLFYVQNELFLIGSEQGEVSQYSLSNISGFFDNTYYLLTPPTPLRIHAQINFTPLCISNLSLPDICSNMGWGSVQKFISLFFK